MRSPGFPRKRGARAALAAGLSLALAVSAPLASAGHSAQVAGAAASPASQPSVPAGDVFGRWARSPAACRRPEFFFEPGRAVIRAPVAQGRTELVYDGVTYARYHRQVEVQLRRPHPYGGAPEKQALLFELGTGRQAVLQLRGDKVAFVRCR